MRARPEPDSYAAVHNRALREFGPASQFACVAPGCDRQAEQWVWLRTGPSRTGIRRGVRVTWGTDLADYAPMCRSHNSMMDRGGTLTHCPNGHERAVYGASRQGNCRECQREDVRRRRANRD